MNKMLDGLKTAGNVAHTENGAKVFESTKSAALDFFSLGGALRNTSVENVMKLFGKAWAENPLYALRTMFYFRDVRGGQGQRKAFRDQIKYLSMLAPESVRKNLKVIPELGRWDDMYALMDTDLEKNVYDVFASQLSEDIVGVECGESISLLGKWLKSENASSKDTKMLARKTRKALGLSSKDYRTLLSHLRGYIDIVERKVSSGDWSGVDYSRVPSQAMMKYRKAFAKHDSDRYTGFVEAVSKGEAKVNAGTLYPYQIIEKCDLGWSYTPMAATEAMALDNQWNALPDYIAGSDENSIAVVDTSGSMSGVPISVAVSLGIYMAERCAGPYKDHFITFSARPQLQQIVGDTIAEKAFNLSKAQWDMNTNLEAVFDLILNTAIDNKISQSEMIDKLYIISDMQFDRCTGRNDHSFFEAMGNKFAKNGYEMPLLVFWNVDARDNMQAPMTIDNRGFLSVSGFSPSIFQSLMDGEVTDAYAMMEKVINGERYSSIEV